MQIRLAYPNELKAIMTIIEEARAFLAQSGSDQWQGDDGYPTQETIMADILNAQAWVGLEDGELVAYAAVCEGHESVYDKIYEGKWRHNNYHYTTFHRIAISTKYRGKGFGKIFLQGLIEGHKGPDFRCDTHEKNMAMQKLLDKLGFLYCGKVPLDGVRLAYQKIKHKSETSLYQEIDEASLL
ncbi:N-acetyltransferase family protein [Streptococcus sp. zg-JUN1979]|uniref:GNAT family N-acetyltransferase n=1 Tax=Streptococcus sp. zg-JUN1979 TaxID=3391450 RepID=UPI0039A52B74